MKKIMFLLFLCMIPLVVKAECTYSERYELNALSSYVDYTYDYNDSTGLFTVKLFNIDSRLEIRYDNVVYLPENGNVTINNIKPGTRMSIGVYSTVENECFNEYLRVVYVSVPYYNGFYGSVLCKGHEDLDICNSRFLDYQISNQTFIFLLNNDDFTLHEKEETVEVVEQQQWYTAVIDIMKKYYIKFIIVIISTTVSVSIYNVIYRKVKHKL